MENYFALGIKEKIVTMSSLQLLKKVHTALKRLLWNIHKSLHFSSLKPFKPKWQDADTSSQSLEKQFKIR
jgi:hypothetical protein